MMIYAGETMDRIIRDEDIEVRIGRADGGRSFIQVLHRPTGVQRHVIGLVGQTSEQVTIDLRDQVQSELIAGGWIKSY
jgi:hypothetical protein